MHHALLPRHAEFLFRIVLAVGALLCGARQGLAEPPRPDSPYESVKGDVHALAWHATSSYRLRDGAILHEEAARAGIPVLGLRRITYQRPDRAPWSTVVGAADLACGPLDPRELAWFAAPPSSDETLHRALEATGADLATPHHEPGLAWVLDEHGGLRAARVHQVLRLHPLGEWQVAIGLADGQWLASRSLLRHLDLTGTVEAWVSPTGEPYHPGVMLSPQPLAFLDVHPVGLRAATTDAAGDFVVPGAVGSVLAVANLSGPHVVVANAGGANAGFLGPLSATSNTLIVFNDVPDEFTTAEVAAFHTIGRGVAFIDGLSPGFAPLQSPVEATVNLAGQCAAFYVPGFGITFTRAGGNCPNAAYSTIVAHEYFHHLAFGIGGWSEPFEEAMADVFAAYLFDTSRIGADFHGPGTTVRDLAGSAQHPNPATDPTQEGLPLAQAFWDLRTNLVTSLGADVGRQVAAELWLGSALLGSGVVGPQVLDLVLLVDDDDADLSNGTPHAAEIVAAFAAHGLGPLVLPVTNLACAVVPATSAGPDVQLTWQLPPHTLTAIEVRRDGVFVTLLPGSSAGVTLTGEPSGTHTYSVRAAAGGVQAIPVTCQLTLAPGGLFLRGDVDGNGSLDLVDAINILLGIVMPGHALSCLDAADVNDNGLVEISDPSYLLFYLFIGGPAPLPPFPHPGVDPTPDGLLCP